MRSTSKYNTCSSAYILKNDFKTSSKRIYLKLLVRCLIIRIVKQQFLFLKTSFAIRRYTLFIQSFDVQSMVKCKRDISPTLERTIHNLERQIQFRPKCCNVFKTNFHHFPFTEAPALRKF